MNMLKDITIGQYIPGESIVHRTDPRIKIGIIALFMITLFVIQNLLLYIPVAISILVVLKLSHLEAKYVIKGLKPLRMIIILTFVINALVTPGVILFQFGFLTLTTEGLVRASFMAIRLILLVVGTSILTLTTSPIELTDGLESLFNPLKRFGFPAHELAMMMTIALRFIPTLIEESEKIMKAQKARGADFESGNIINRAKNLVPLLVPLFINSLRRADELATAMEARCYRGGDFRTRLNPLELEKKDWMVFAVAASFCVLLIGVNLFLPPTIR